MQLTDYEVLCIIGSGSFGVCYKVKHKRNDEIYVWKAIDYGCMSEEQKQLLVSEVNLLKELKHPNIVQYHDRIIHTETQILYIIMEWCEQGDLGKLISRCKETNSFIEEKFIWRVLYQTAKALRACHTHKSKLTVLHRDIKPANVFLDKDGNVKLGDFGLARVVKKNSFSDTIVGTPNYMSPELIKGEKYNKKSDIWSLGCLVYELCALHPPFYSDNFHNLSDNIKQGRFKKIPSHYSEDLHKIIKLLLNTDCTYRPTVEIIIHHPTVVSNLSSEFGSPNLVKNNVKKCTSFLEKLNNSEKIYQNDIQIPLKQKSKSDSESLYIDNNLPSLAKTIEKAGNNLDSFKNPRDISQDTFKQIWLSKLEDVRLRELNLKIAEEKLKEREKALEKKEKQVELLNKLAKEKLSKAETMMKNYRISNKCLRPRRKAKKIDYLDLDSTLSAADVTDICDVEKLKPITENVKVVDNNPQPNKPVRKKNLLSIFKSNSNKNNKEETTPEKDKENIPKDYIEKTSVWNADNKKAAFELLALLNSQSTGVERRHRNQDFNRGDDRRKSMIVLKKSTIL